MQTAYTHTKRHTKGIFKILSVGRDMGFSKFCFCAFEGSAFFNAQKIDIYLVYILGPGNPQEWIQPHI